MPAPEALHTNGADPASILLRSGPQAPAEPGYRVIRRNGGLAASTRRVGEGCTFRIEGLKKDKAVFETWNEGALAWD